MIELARPIRPVAVRLEWFAYDGQSMARLDRRDGSDWWLLPARCLIGRSRVCSIQLQEPEVSGEHAILRWVDGVWELQDLNSRNGSYVDGRRLAAGQRVKLLAGVELGFGQPGGFVLVSGDEPQVHASPLDATGPAFAARDGLLVLPSPDEPELTLYSRGQQWVLESASELRAVEDGEVVETGTGRFRLHLPITLPKTDEPRLPQLARLSLHFLVARDEEYIELLARCGDQTIDLKARAHHRTLLQLARRRLADLELPTTQQGWMQQDELMRRLAIDAGVLHLDIHRIRRQLADAGIADAAHVIERRPGTRQVRIGVSSLEIESTV